MPKPKPSVVRVAHRHLAHIQALRRPGWLEKLAELGEETLDLDCVDRGRWLIETCRYALDMEKQAESRLNWARNSDSEFEKLKSVAIRANTALRVAERVIKGTASSGEFESVLDYLDQAIRGLDAWGAHE